MFRRLNTRLLRSICTAAVTCGLIWLITSTAMAGPSYEQAVLDSGPIAYWRLGETAGVTAASLVDPTGTNGTYTNPGNITLGQLGPGPADGLPGFDAGNLAPQFGGSGGHVSLPGGFLPTGSAPRTLEGWFNGGNNNQTFFNYGPNSTGKRMSVTASNSRVAVAVSGHNYGVNGLSLSGWNHLAIVLPQGQNKSDQFRFFVNGEEITDAATGLAGSTKTINTTDSLQRIASSQGSGTFPGLIDEVAVYDRALGREEILSHYMAAEGQSAQHISLYEGAALPETGIPNYTGVENVRLNDGVGLNSAMTGQQLFLGDAGNDADNRALVDFDMTPLAGWQAVGDATLRLRVSGKDGTVNAADVFELYQIADENGTFAHGQSSWNHLVQSSNTPWQDLSGNDLPTGPSPAGGLGAPGEGYEVAPLDTISQSSYPTGSFIEFNVPQAIVQDMIDQDATGTRFPGFLLRHADENLAGRLTLNDLRSGANGPTLSLLVAPAAVPVPTTGYAGAVTADAPLLYLRMEETVGPVAFNTANPGANAIYANAPAIGQSGPGSADGLAGFGPTNNAVGLDGVDDTVDILPLAVSGNAARTYEGWFNGTESKQAYFSITGGTGRRTSITAANDEVSMAVNGHRFGVTFNSTNIGSPQSNIFTPEELAPGWHHFAITLPDGATRSNEFQFIVDGVDVTPYARTLAGSAKTVNTLSDFGRMGATDTGAPMSGTVDEFAVYDRDLGWQGVADHFGSAHNDLATITQNTFDPSLLQSVAIQSHDQWPDTSDNTDRSDILRVRERTTGGSNQPVRTRSFFEFDLSEIEGEEVLGAMLVLNQDSRNVNTGYLTLGRVTDDWTGETVAFDQAFADDFTFGGTNTSATGNDKVSWIDVTDIVSNWVDGTEENHGFRLALRDRGFYIADFYDSGPLAPQLVVTTLAVPEPAGLALLGLGGMLLLVFWRRKGNRAASSRG